MKTYHISIVTLLFANLIPLYGVLSGQISGNELLLLYWFESAIVGFFTILKILFVPKDHLQKILLIPFFITHYGGFMLGHLLFLTIIVSLSSSQESFAILKFPDGLLQRLTIPVMALYFSHGVSFFVNYIGKKEYERHSLGYFMTAPYARIMVMHVAILFGWGATLILRNSFVSSMLLIALKVVVDVMAHLQERKSSITTLVNNVASERQPEIQQTGLGK